MTVHVEMLWMQLKAAIQAVLHRKPSELNDEDFRGIAVRLAPYRTVVDPYLRTTLENHLKVVRGL